MKNFSVNQVDYEIRTARKEDASKLSKVRVKIDGETENLDREPGEEFIDEAGFIQIIKTDDQSKNHLFLVAEVNGEIAGYSRCEGSKLKRTSHRIEFGVCVLQKYWGYRIGQNLLAESIHWADSNGVKKITLTVLETNDKAIKLYRKYGFEVEGVLKEDKLLSDGRFYHSVIMGRIK